MSESGVFLDSGAQTLLDSSLSLGKLFLQDRVEHFAEEIEPLVLGDLAVTISVERREELINFSAVNVLHVLLRKVDDLISVDRAVAVSVERVERLESTRQSLLSFSGDHFLSLLCHLLCQRVFQK